MTAPFQVGDGEGDWLEIRPDAGGDFDEIFVRFAGGSMVHVETMTDKSVYIGFYREDIGETLQLWIKSKKPLEYHYERSKDAPACRPTPAKVDA